MMPPLSDEQKAELTPLEQDLRKRNICIKRLFNIPMADLEMIFPDRKLHLQPITIVQLVFNMVAGLVAAYMMVAKVTAGGHTRVHIGGCRDTHLNTRTPQTEITMSLLVSVLGLVGGRVAQVYGQAQTELVNTERTLNKQVYERNVASQEAVLFQTLNDMLEQHLKEAVLLFFTLLAKRGMLAVIYHHHDHHLQQQPSCTHPAPMSQEQVQQSTEQLLKDRFSIEMSLDVDNVLPQLLLWGIVQKDPATGMLTGMTLADGLAQLDKKWDSCFTYTGNAKRKPTAAVVREDSVSLESVASESENESKFFSISGLLRKRRSS